MGRSELATNGTGRGAMDLVVDRSSPVPLYFQLAQHLEHAIESGQIPPDTLLDNEIQLAGQLGRLRPTVRRAMHYLVEKRLLVRRRGSGRGWSGRVCGGPWS